MNCPSCKAEIVMPALDVETHGRRVSRVERCSCGVEVQISSREGWDRWYATAWRPAGTPGHGGWRHDAESLPDRAAFYARLEGRPLLTLVN